MELVRVLVGGLTRAEQELNGDSWVALAAGETYEIDVASPFSRHVKAVISVDGKNVMDGKPVADPLLASGVVLSPGNATRIPGWRLAKDEWASFEVRPHNESYRSTEQLAGHEPGRIDIQYVEGYTDIATPMVRGNVPADLGTAFGAFRKEEFIDRPFTSKRMLISKTVFYASPELLASHDIGQRPTPPQPYCEPPKDWKKQINEQNEPKKPAHKSKKPPTEG